MRKSEKREFKCQDAEMPWLRALPTWPILPMDQAQPTWPILPVHHTWLTGPSYLWTRPGPRGPSCLWARPSSRGPSYCAPYLVHVAHRTCGPGLAQVRMLVIQECRPSIPLKHAHFLELISTSSVGRERQSLMLTRLSGYRLSHVSCT